VDIEMSEGHYPPIADYALIGDCRSAALISRDGSLDWLCLPRFDSPAVFAALLDRSKGGRFRVRPVGGFASSRRYVEDSNVLETTFLTGSGTLRLRDLMPVGSEEEKRRELWPNHQILRQLECVEGEVEVEVLCDPRPDYGRRVPGVVDRGAFGFRFRGGPNLLLRSELPLGPLPDRPGIGGRARLRAGERRYVSLTFNLEEPAVVPPFGEVAERKLEQTLRWWGEWASRCRYEGPYRNDVVRSALTLKLMTYAPSGAVIAAPTASLPEWIGGVRNWDYRYCWLRDASLTLRALFDLGYTTEGEAFLEWLIDAIRLSAPDVQIMYDVAGERRMRERELEHLEGYAGSRPVRVGNDAAGQFQLDTYGEVVDAAFEYVRRGGRIGRDAGRLLVGLGETTCRRWREPDEGIWEIRGGRRHHTYSKAMCWVALDRLVRLHEAGHLKAPMQPFARVRDEIRAEVERRGYNERLGSYVSVYDGEQLDASLLLLGIYGYADGPGQRMRGTCERVYEHLGTGPLLHRYRDDDGLPPGEGAFGIASFWGVEVRALQGELDSARTDFERLCGYANEVGLFAEEIDPETGACLGNFPQAFTHVGLISAALALEQAAAEREGEPRAVAAPPHTVPVTQNRSLPNAGAQEETR
jgi:GH15 family glucan-1,4-alpha-glucosidase